MSYLDKMLDYFISNKNLGESKKSYEQKVDEERKRIRREIEIDNNYNQRNEIIEDYTKLIERPFDTSITDKY